MERTEVGVKCWGKIHVCSENGVENFTGTGVQEWGQFLVLRYMTAIIFEKMFQKSWLNLPSPLRENFTVTI